MGKYGKLRLKWGQSFKDKRIFHDFPLFPCVFPIPTHLTPFTSSSYAPRFQAWYDPYGKSLISRAKNRLADQNPDISKNFPNWLVVWNIFYDFPYILGMSWSQLTFTPSFFRGVGSTTTNQINIPLTSHEYLILIPMISHYWSFTMAIHQPANSDHH